MQHIHAKHGIASAIISMLRSLTLSDWAFFFEFQQNSRTATRMARARPQTSTTKTPPGTGKTGSSLFYRLRLSLLLLATPRACFTVNVPVTEFHSGSVRPSITPLTPHSHPSTPVYLSIYLSICLASRLYDVIYLYSSFPLVPLLLCLLQSFFPSPSLSLSMEIWKEEEEKRKIGKKGCVLRSIITIEWKNSDKEMEKYRNRVIWND